MLWEVNAIAHGLPLPDKAHERSARLALCWAVNEMQYAIWILGGEYGNTRDRAGPKV
jgi:hypothetical protein